MCARARFVAILDGALAIVVASTRCDPSDYVMVCLCVCVASGEQQQVTYADTIANIIIQVQMV